MEKCAWSSQEMFRACMKPEGVEVEGREQNRAYRTQGLVD